MLPATTCTVAAHWLEPLPTHLAWFTHQQTKIPFQRKSQSQSPCLRPPNGEGPASNMRRSKILQSKCALFLRQLLSKKGCNHDQKCTSFSSYQYGPDIYLLQVKDPDFTARLREYLGVAKTTSAEFMDCKVNTY